jgi:hypothetical protein
MLLRTATALVFVLATVGVAWADAVLFTPGIRAGTDGALSCTAVNIGPDTLDSIVLTLVTYPPSTPGSGSATCNNIPSARVSTSGAVCSRGFGGPVEAYCRVTVIGGGKSWVRAVLSVWDSNGSAIQSVGAE